jgi:phosphatidylglycerophosphate synthase
MTDKAQRTTTSLTSGWEKKNLPRIAAALPAWVTPDQLTGLGVVAAAITGAGYVMAAYSPLWLFLSIAGLFLHWAGDSLDGTLARVRKQEREKYGYYVDRTADAISVVIMCVAFGLSPYVSLHVGLLLAIGYLLLMVYAEVCAYVSKKFPLSFARIGPTEARIILAAFTLILFVRPPSREALDALGLGASALMFGAFLVSSALEARRLDRLDRVRERSPGVSGPTSL